MPNPTQSEVLAYAAEQTINKVLAERFYAYYTERQWTTNGYPITNWRSVLHLWHKRAPKSSPPPNEQSAPGGSPSPPQEQAEAVGPAQHPTSLEVKLSESERQYRRVLKERREAQSPEARQAMEDFFRKYQLKLNFSE